MKEQGPLEPRGQTDEQASVAQIGNQLRQARESKGVSVVQVAREIRLDVRHLEALEAADFDRLPGAVFVRGYLRSYGRYLGLDPEPLVTMYGRAFPAAEPPIFRPTTKPRYAVALGWIPWSQLGSAVFVVAALVGAFWLGSILYGMFAPGSFDSSESAAPAGGTILPLPPLSPLPSAEESARALPPSDVVSSPPPEAAQTAPSGTIGGEPPPATVPDDFTTAPESVPAPSPSQPRGTLSLEFTEDSWVEVYDAADRRLISRIGRAGENPVLEGIPPFSVVLGFAPGVAVAYNGQPIEVRTRGQVARLTVGDHGR